jgi:hypothetical protein
MQTLLLYPALGRADMTKVKFKPARGHARRSAGFEYGMSALGAKDARRSVNARSPDYGRSRFFSSTRTTRGLKMRASASSKLA